MSFFIRQILNVMKIFKDHLHDAKASAHELLDTSRVFEHDLIKTLQCEGVDEGVGDEAVNVTSQLWEDSGLQEYITSATITKGGGERLWKSVQNLTTDTKLLKNRQSVVLPDNCKEALEELATYEKDVLWLCQVPDIKKAWPINMLFPTTFGLRLINNFPYLLEAFHIYRCYIAPWMNIITPVSTILGPWIYVRRSLQWAVPFTTYCKLLFTAVKAAFRVTGNLRRDLTRVIMVLVYVTLFIYTTVQSFQTAQMLRKIRRDLHDKLKAIRRFVAVAEGIISSTPSATLAAWGIDKSSVITEPIVIPNQINGMYRLMTDQHLQTRLRTLIKAVYTLDICCTTRKLIDNRTCVPVEFATAHGFTAMWNMGHILLPTTQVRNPIALQKNIIVTGPNAAGKTTYVRSIFTNMILAQSLGIACASRAIIRPCNAIGTFIRVSDTLGKASLFEAEAQRCAEMIKQARAVSEKGQAGLFFLDEPMHSTPPVEGMSTCRAVLEELAKMSGIRTVTTTHFIQVTDVAKDIPESFMNLSMVAFKAPSDDVKSQYTFPYKIRSGSSSQCIALELLKDHELPFEVVVRAIELKNKFCNDDVNESS